MRAVLAVTSALLLLLPLGPPLHAGPAAAPPAERVDDRRAGDTTLLHAGDLAYLGAFRLPAIQSEKARWGYGGSALTYRPDGDPGGDGDGFPGSLFGAGHPSFDAVSEVSIPAPVLPRNHDAKGLPVARTLQPFADPTGGLRERAGADELGDLAFLPEPGGPGRLYWTVFEYYNVAGRNHLSHGVSRADLTRLEPQGVWRLGPESEPSFHAARTADYVFPVDAAWAARHLGGRSLVSGRHRTAGAFGGSQGPALFAFAPPRPPWPAHGAALDALPLVYYPEGRGAFPEYRACDEWEGGAWLQDGGRAALLIAGRKGLGAVHYGEPRSGDCMRYKGYHCDPYEPQLLLYAPDELAASARGERKPWSVVPYAVIRPGPLLFPSCGGNLGGVAFDGRSGLLYVMQRNADRASSPYEPQPLVHVFRVGGKAPQPQGKRG